MKENSKLAVELHRQHMLYCLPLFYLGLYLHDEQKRKHNYTRFQNGPDVRHPNLEKKDFCIGPKANFVRFQNTLQIRIHCVNFIIAHAQKHHYYYFRFKNRPQIRIPRVEKHIGARK